MQVHSLLDSFNYALEGLIHTFKTQRNMKIHFVIAFLVLLSSFFLDLSGLEVIILFISIAFVVAMELVNTAIEIVIDLISEEYRFQARIAKNIAAASVLMAAANAVVVAYLILSDRLFPLTEGFTLQLNSKPVHFVLINLGLLFIIIITLKARRGRGTPLSGGMPSGHSAVSFAIAAMVILLTGNFLIGTLAVLLALLVAQSRLQSRTHTLLEVLAGAVLGVGLTILLFQLL